MLATESEVLHAVASPAIIYKVACPPKVSNVSIVLTRELLTVVHDYQEAVPLRTARDAARDLLILGGLVEKHTDHPQEPLYLVNQEGDAIPFGTFREKAARRKNQPSYLDQLANTEIGFLLCPRSERALKAHTDRYGSAKEIAFYSLLGLGLRAHAAERQGYELRVKKTGPVIYDSADAEELSAAGALALLT